MQAISRAGQPDWQPDQTFAQSHGHNISQNDVSNEIPNEKASKPTGPTIRQIRESMSINPERQQRTSSTVRPQPTAPKKKPSIFGGLFATKEPTQIALNQVAAQMIAQHGSTSAVKVPNVRMEKMPDHVPRVNSKWDGVPDSIKERERREKERQKALKRQSAASTLPRARSIESSDRSGRYFLSNGSSSRDHSISSKAISSHSRRSNPRSPNPHKFYAQSVNSSGDLASQQRPDAGQESSTIYSQSLHSPSASSLPDIPISVVQTPAVPAIYRTDRSPAIRQLDLNGMSMKSKASHLSTGTAPPSDGTPDHTSSPIPTPREGSPVTPSIQPVHEHFSGVGTSIISSQGSVSLDSSGPPNWEMPVGSKWKSMIRPSEAFLAGEAQPLELRDDEPGPVASGNDLPLRQWGNLPESFVERKVLAIPSRNPDRVAQDLSKRPDSSRSRLGLKASMLVRTDAAPWEGQTGTALSPRSANARNWRGSSSNARSFLPSLGSLRKKES